MVVMLYRNIKTVNQTLTKMKNLIRILNVFFLLALLSQGVSGQTEKDTVAVLQKCIDLKDLKQFLPLNSDGTIGQLYILQDRISFPASTNVEIAGKKIALIDLPQLEDIADPYYLQFWDFRISQDLATVGFMLNYRPDKNTKELVRVVAEAEKKGTEWMIIDVKITRVQ